MRTFLQLLFLSLLSGFSFAQDHTPTSSINYKLVSDDLDFYFIDQSGNRINRLGTWEAALSFDQNGLAIVTKNTQRYALDSRGNTYLLARYIENIKLETQAFIMKWDEAEDKFPNTVMTFPQLEILVLDRPKYDDLKSFKLPKSIKELSNLRYLSIANHRTTHLPHTIGLLQKLIYLNLEGNSFHEFPKELLHLKQLKQLNLKRCYLNTLDIDFSPLKDLEYLNLSWNSLRKLPPSIANLTQLRQLDLSGNQFIKLPNNLTSLKNLQRIDLLKNRLTSLPSGIGQLKHLKHLNLLGNSLGHLPIEICYLSRLESLGECNLNAV